MAQAQLISGRLDDRAINSSRYILNVGTYTRTARARILYNHIYFSALSDDKRRALLANDFTSKSLITKTSTLAL